LIGGLVLAAGAATRFGAPKQLAELDGIPLLEHALRTMTAAPVGRVVVVLGSGAEEIASTVNLHGADTRVCSRWDEGQSASLACGLAELASCEAVVVTLGDQPRMSADAIRRVIAARKPHAATRAPATCFSASRYSTCPATTWAAARTWTRRRSSTPSVPAGR
jgi:CTP:molybdopterin cytidylyltransferase MocA